MTIDEANEILGNVEFFNYVFTAKNDSRGTMYMQAVYDEPDIITGIVEPQHTRRWLLSPTMVKSELVQTAFKCALTSMEHRTREHFLYKGERVYGPHFDVEALVEIARAKRLDYRKK